MNIEKYKYKIFGRFKGRKKININYENCIDNFRIDIKNDINQNRKNILDVGSGNGNNAILLSKKNPDSNIFTCEIYKDGNINLSQNIKKNNISNILLFEGNVLEFMDELNDKFVFDEVWILFPDPWPKARHHKRRLINRDFFKKIYIYLKNSGNLLIATDSDSYKEEIIKLIYEFQNMYLWKNQKYSLWNYDALDLPRTKFYQKALKSNRKSMFFQLNKI